MRWTIALMCSGAGVRVCLPWVISLTNSRTGLPSAISAGDASHILGGESPGAARGCVVGSCHGDFYR